MDFYKYQMNGQFMNQIQHVRQVTPVRQSGQILVTPNKQESQNETSPQFSNKIIRFANSPPDVQEEGVLNKSTKQNVAKNFHMQSENEFNSRIQVPRNLSYLMQQADDYQPYKKGFQAVQNLHYLSNPFQMVQKQPFFEQNPYNVQHFQPLVKSTVFSNNKPNQSNLAIFNNQRSVSRSYHKSNSKNDSKVEENFVNDISFDSIKKAVQQVDFNKFKSLSPMSKQQNHQQTNINVKQFVDQPLKQMNNQNIQQQQSNISVQQFTEQPNSNNSIKQIMEQNSKQSSQFENSLKQQIEIQQNEIKHLKEYITQLQLQLSSMDSQDTQDQYKQFLQNQHALDEETIAKLNEENTQLMHKNHQYLAQEDTLKDLQNQNKKSQQKLVEANMENQKLIQDHENKLLILMEQNDQLIEANQQLKKNTTLEQMKIESESSIQRNIILKEKEQELRQLQQRNIDMETQFAEMQQNYLQQSQSLQLESQTLQKENQAIIRENQAQQAKLQNQIQELQTQLNDQKIKKNLKVDQKQEKLVDLSDDLDKLKLQYKEMQLNFQEQIRNIQNEHKDHTRTLNVESQDLLNEKQLQIQDLQRENQFVNKIKEELMQQNNILQSKNNEINQESFNQQQQNHLLQKENHILQSNLEILQKELAAYKQKSPPSNQIFEQDIQKLQKQNKILIKDYQILEKDFLNQKNHLQNNQLEFKRLQNQIHQLGMLIFIIITHFFNHYLYKSSQFVIIQYY